MFFTRRRLQAMLDSLSPILGDEKSRDLVNRVEDKRVEQALPAQMELSLLWAFSQFGEIEIEPEWWGRGRPDVYSETFSLGKPIAVEIASATDNELSGEKVMDRITLLLGECANRSSRGSADFLYYRFREESGYEEGAFFRRRLVPEDYEVSEQVERLVAGWIADHELRKHPLRIAEAGLDVEIEYKQHRQRRFHNFWSSIPPEVYSPEDNPIYKLLERKTRQLSGPNADALRFILLADVGSDLLKRTGVFNESDHLRRRVSGSEIISHFMSNRKGRLDGIAVISAYRSQNPQNRARPKWRITFFGRPGAAIASDFFDRLLEVLPLPRFEGYQARSLFRQGGFSPKKMGWYVGMSIKSFAGDLEVSVSARALLDFLAGRITAEQFRYCLGERKGEKNLFNWWLEQGMTLSNITMGERSLDEDDDHIVLHLRDDPSARQLKVAAPLSDGG